MLLVDAFNLIHASRDLTGVADLLSRLASGRHAGRDITLVCDGSVEPRDAHEQAVVTRCLSGSRSRRVLYAGPHREADDLIEDLLREARDAARITLVSSDRRLRQAAARAGAGCIESRDFLRDLEEDGVRRAARAERPDPVLDRASVAWWMAEFGLAPRRDPPTPTPTHTHTPSPFAAPNSPEFLPAPRPPVGPAPNGPAARPRPLAPPAPDLNPLHADLHPEAFPPEDLDMERWLRSHPPGPGGKTG